jgi:hypothetical protein
MTGSVSKKLGIKAGMRAILVNVQAEARKAINLPHLDLATRLHGKFDYIHFFVRSRKEFNDKFPRLKAHLKPTGMLWVSWPKKGELGTDLTLPAVIDLGYKHGLVESKTISIDTTWSAIKFTHPKKGKVYDNRYGKLKS